MNIINLSYNGIIKRYFIGEGPNNRNVEEAALEKEVMGKIAKKINPKRKTDLYLHDIQEDLVSKLEERYSGTKINIIEN